MRIQDKEGAEMIIRRALLLLTLLAALLPLRAQLNTGRIMEIGRNALYFEDYVLSIQYFNRVVNAKPYLHEPYFFRGLAKYNLDDFKGAEEDLDKAIEINPYVSRSYQLRGMCRAKRDSIEKASADFRMAIKYDPQNPVLWQNLAVTAMQAEEWEQAAQIVDTLSLFSPRYTVAYLMRSQIAVKQNDSIIAMTMADKAVETDPFSSDVYELRAMVHSEYERYDAAETDITRAIELMPGRSGYYITRAIIRYWQGNLSGSMDDYDMALYVEPKSFIAHYNRGILRMHLGDDNNAIEDFNFVLDVDPDNTMARFNRALLLDQVGDTHAALDDYNRVLKDYPMFEYGYRCRAAARRKVGDMKGANADEAWIFEHVMALNTGNKPSAPSNRKEDTTRKRSDRNVSNYNKMIAAYNEYGEDYLTEYRGKVQNRDIPVELEPMFVLTYYEDMQELRGDCYYKPVEDMNKAGVLPYKLLITNRERALSSNEVERHFASLDELSQKIVDDSGSVYHRLARALDYYLIQDLDAAMDDLDTAFALEGELWSIYFARAFVRYKMLESEHLNELNSPTTGAGVKRDGALPNIDYRLVKSDLDKVVALMPDFKYAFFNRGNVLVKLSDFKSAVLDYTEALKLDDKFAEAYFNRGLARIYLGNVEEGIADLSKAGELGIFAAYNLIKRYREHAE